jgi:hypothetical protein
MTSSRNVGPVDCIPLMPQIGNKPVNAKTPHPSMVVDHLDVRLLRTVRLKSRCLNNALGSIVSLIVLVLLATVLAVNLWILTQGVLGTAATIFSLVAVIAGAAEFSRRSGQGIVGSLVQVGFGGVTLLIGALFGIAAHALIIGM